MSRESTELFKANINCSFILIYYLWHNQSLLSRGGIERFMIYLHFECYKVYEKSHGDLNWKWLTFEAMFFSSPQT